MARFSIFFGIVVLCNSMRCCILSGGLGILFCKEAFEVAQFIFTLHEIAPQLTHSNRTKVTKLAILYVYNHISYIWDTSTSSWQIM